MIIGLNADKEYYEKYPDLVITTIQLFKDYEIYFFQIDFYEEIEGVKCIKVNSDELEYSYRTDVTNRERYVCLEGGEFLKYVPELRDDEIFILLDYDILQQRKMNLQEKIRLNSLGEYEFGVCKNDYTNNLNSEDELKIVCPDAVHNEIFDIPPFEMFNMGFQSARISGWKKLYEEWKFYYKRYNLICKHHASGQLLINYILHKNNMIKKLPASIQSGWWMQGLKWGTIGNMFVLQPTNQVPLFYHHAWRFRFKQ